MKLLRLFCPKSRLSWLLLAACITGFAAVLGPRLKHAQGIILSIAVVGALLGGLNAVPCAWIARWERLPFLLRGLLFGVAGYCVIVTLGCFDEINSFRLWWEFLAPCGASPVTQVHSAGLVTAAYLFTTQIYRIDPPPADQEQVLSGDAFISQDEARQRARSLRNRS